MKQLRYGARIGIAGTGQLGRMSGMAAADLGMHAVPFGPATNGDWPDPAEQVAAAAIMGNYDEPGFAELIASAVDVVTYEFENVPLDFLQELQAFGVELRPSIDIMEVAQSRWLEKETARKIRMPTVPTLLISQLGNKLSEQELMQCLPGILKSDRLGYDGKGQIRVDTIEDVYGAMETLGVDCVLEKRIDIKSEHSVLVARNELDIKVSDVVTNTHKDGILDTTTFSGRGLRDNVLEIKIANFAMIMATHLNLYGILVLEFMVDTDGNLYFNEVAPRPHNSFHASREAAYTSQFEQQIRAVGGLPLGDVEFHTSFVMTNLIGYEWDDWSRYLYQQKTRLTLYGKAESKPGRKMGHIVELGDPIR